MLETISVIIDKIIILVLVIFVIKQFRFQNYFYKKFNKLKKRIKMTEQEFIQGLKDVKANADKAKKEVLDKITALEAIINSKGQISQEMQDALTDLKGSVKAIDDIVPDATDGGGTTDGGSGTTTPPAEGGDTTTPAADSGSPKGESEALAAKE